MAILWPDPGTQSAENRCNVCRATRRSWFLGPQGMQRCLGGQISPERGPESATEEVPEKGRSTPEPRWPFAPRKRTSADPGPKRCVSDPGPNCGPARSGERPTVRGRLPVHFCFRARHRAWPEFGRATPVRTVNVGPGRHQSDTGRFRHNAGRNRPTFR